MHKVKKSSGFNGEELGHRSANVIMNALAIDMVLSLSIMLHEQYSRKNHHLELSKIFPHDEIHVHERYAESKKFSKPTTFQYFVNLF